MNKIGQQLSKNAQTLGKALLLAVVYSLHLFFYQALIAAPAVSSASSFTIGHNVPQNGHHVLSDYRMLLKHEDGKRNFEKELFAAPAFGVVEAFLIHPEYHSSFSSVCTGAFRVSDKLARLYLRCRVFLI
jgi:hypothetical protein